MSGEAARRGDGGAGVPARAAAAIAVAVAALGFVLALHPLLEPDVFWHLASGRWVLDHGMAPRTDPFSWAYPAAEWLDFQWLFDAALVSAWSAGGADLLVLLKAAAFAALGILMVRAARAGGASVSVAALSAAVGLLASAERTTERPELLTYIALSVVGLVLERVRAGASRRELAWIPALVVPWINVHSLAFLGPALVLWHAVVEALPGRDASRRPGLVRPLLIAGVASAVALLANPYGVKAWTFPLTLFRRIGKGPEVFGRILEFASPLQSPGDPPLRFFWVLLVLLLAAPLARRGAFPWRRLLAILPFLVLALMARRNIPLFAVMAAPAAAIAASRGRREAPRAALTSALVVAAAAFAILRGASAGLLGLPRERGLGVLPGLFPEECLAAADRLALGERVFHDLDFGGFITWRDPQRKTFLDGRLEVAGPARLAEFVDAHEDPAAWQALCRRHDPQWLLLQHSSRGSAAFLRAALDGGRWRAICWSPEAALLVRADLAEGMTPVDANRPWVELLRERRGPEPHAGHALDAWTRPLDRALRRDPVPSAVRRTARWANLQLTLGRVSAARGGYDAILAVAPDDPEALFNRGLCAQRAGDREEAERIWKDALGRVDRSSRDLFRRAIAGEMPRER